ncbi:MAG: LacI family DNA-binding transcriptional regulator [Oscillospiraceae bacterium]
MADIKDVARQAGVSISTVSRVINDSKAVSPELKSKVNQAIARIGYSANSVARGLKIFKTNNIAIIITSVSRTFFASVLEGANNAADQLGYSMIIAETHDSLEREMQLVDAFASQWVDGIVLASSAYGNDPKTVQYIEKLQSLEKKGMRIPVITLEYALDSQYIDAVVIDHEKAAYKAVCYLINSINRKNIIHISLPKNHLMGRMRIAGYKRAFEESGLVYDENNIIAGDYTTYSGYKIVKQLLADNRKFDAIFCANDQMAVGAIKACEEFKILIPEQVAIVGNDDIFAASIVSPSLTSISVPKFELGATAVRRMHEIIGGDGTRKPRQIISLDTSFEERESTVRNAKRSLKYLEW